MSATVLWIMVVVIVVALAVWLIMVRYSDRHPGHKTRRREQMRGMVQGGQHVGGGRSVMPRRDAPVPEGGEVPNPDLPDVEDAEADQASRGPSARRNSGNPMDL
jgi:hypothetical protein